MIAYFLGLPGSGKTYYAVNTIYNNFTDNPDAKKDLKKDYYSCFTNINQFNYNKCENVFELDFNLLYKNLSKLFELKKRGLNDDELIEKAKEFNLYKTLFVIDECHDKFDTQDKVLVWWLTYHRHLYHDIFLITQSLSLVHSKYKPLAEAFYKAKPLSLILGNKNFKYDYYIESRLNKASFVNTVSVKKNQNVFKLYKSGDSVGNKNVIVRFIIITLFLACLLVSLAYFFYFNTEKKIKPHSVIKSKVINHSSVPSSSAVIINNSDSIDDDFLDKKLFVLNCSRSECSNSDFSIPPQLLFKFEKMNLLHIHYKEKVSKYLTRVYLSTNNNFYNFLTSIKENKQNDNQATSLNLFGSDSTSSK